MAKENGVGSPLDWAWEKDKQEREPKVRNFWSFMWAIAYRFGFQAVLVLFLLGFIYKTEQDHRADVTAQLTAARTDEVQDQKAFLDALQKNTDAVQAMSNQMAVMNAKIDDRNHR